MKPLFITLEGADCAGKASQSKLLADGIGATLFSSPDYTTPSGILLKKHLHEEWAAASLDKSVQIGCDGKHHGRGTADCPRELHHHHDDRCLPIYRALPTQDNMIVRQALMVLNRLEMQVKVEEALKSGPVVADRWHDSAIVYGSVEGVPVPEGFLQPDLRILLDMTWQRRRSACGCAASPTPTRRIWRSSSGSSRPTWGAGTGRWASRGAWIARPGGPLWMGGSRSKR